jgi:putative membrane protein
MPPEPGALLGVAIAALAYGRGVTRLWARAGRGRGVSSWQVAWFASGLLIVLIALESPLDGLSAALFAAHMVQHLLLILVAAPLLVLGTPVLPFLWAAPEASRRGLGALWKRLNFLEKPAVAFTLHSLALWAWHLPVLYEAALNNRVVHVLEHLSFLGTAILFWFAVLGPGRAAFGLGVLLVFALALQSTILGALLAFSPTPWYTAHLTSAARWGLSPLEDQQVAGLVMWIPGGSIYLAAALGLFAAWLKETNQPARTPDPEAHTPARQ